MPAGAQDKAWTAELSTAQSGAAASADGKPPRLDPLSGPQVKLKPKERRGVRHGRSWADNPDFPARGEDGGIVFVFGATLPIVVCAPLYVCDLTCRPARSSTTSISAIACAGRSPRQPKARRGHHHPCDHQADRCRPDHQPGHHHQPARLHHQAGEPAEDWMPKRVFCYPDARPAAVERLPHPRAAARGGVRAPRGRTRRSRFRLCGQGDSPAWRPVRVFSSGGKTYIEFPRRRRARRSADAGRPG